jgi:hypothetical protein
VSTSENLLHSRTESTWAQDDVPEGHFHAEDRPPPRRLEQ